MTLGNTSRVSVQYKNELTYGAINTTTGSSTKYREVRVTGESLDYKLTKTDSAEINATRSISSQTPTSASSSGGIQGEFIHGEYDLFLQNAMQSTFTAFGTNGVSSSLTTTTVTTTTINGTLTGASGLAKGQWFRVVSAGNNNGKLLRVHTSTAPTNSVITLDAGTPAAASTSESIVIQAARLVNGTTLSSYSVQRNINDMSPVEYFTYRGQVAAKFSLNIASAALTTVSFDFMGKDGVRGTPGTNPLIASSNVNVASQTTPVHSSVNTTGCVVWANGSALTGTYVKSIALDYDNTLRAQEAVCNLGPVAIGSGTIKASVKMQLYFAEGAKFFTEFTGNTAQEIVFSTADSSGNVYVFTLPAANVADYKVNAGGKDSDLLVDVTFTALRDTTAASGTYQSVMAIDRCGVAIDLS